MSFRARLFAFSFIAVGLVAMALVLGHWHSTDLPRFCVLMLLEILGSRMKFRIPRANGTVTAGMIVMLIAIVELSPSEALAIALAGSLVQILLKRSAPVNFLQFLFNFSSFGTSVSLTAGCYHFLVTNCAFLSQPLNLVVIGVVYFALNSGPVAAIISLTGNGDGPDWRHDYGWMVLFYIASSCLAGALHLLTTTYGWQAELLALPVLLMASRTYQVFIGRIEDGQRHTDELQELQFRSIHTLALAVEAKDENTNAHLHRVRSYANALGRELGLKGDELKALDAAAILHDIGKLAVPEHIIAKPGKLTPEEFDQMKIHTVVGASIVEEMQFPYPVAPLVRGHHEKWDGSGYPDGLAGDAIPIGARILAAVDCLDAMASDRPYRRAMPLEKAMSIVRAEAGKSYDPRVIKVLDRSYVTLQAAARESLGQSKNAISANVQVTRGDAPATGFEASSPPAAGPDPLSNLQAALDVQNAVAGLAEVSAGMSPSALASTLSGLITRVLPHDSLVLFQVSDEDVLEATGVHGVDADLLSPLRVPLRQGLAGWVAHHREPIVNGDPGVEIGAERWPRPTLLRTALAAPLQSANRTVGVVALYRRDKDSFNRSELGMLDLLTPRLGECLAATTETEVKADVLDQPERFVANEGNSMVLVRIDLDGNPSPEAAADCIRAIREALPPGAVFLELRPRQLAVVSNHGPAFIENLKETAEAVFIRAGVLPAIGGAIFAPGAALDTVLADAERALADSKRQGAPQGLLQLQSAVELEVPRNADVLVR